MAIVSVYTYPLVLKPGTYLRGRNDPLLYTWILGWVGNKIFTNPAQIFDTNIFYPHGNTLAYSEPLFVPGVLSGGPIYMLTGNPILAHNITLLLFQALCGWAAYYAARRLTGSEAGSLLAGIAFCVSPFRTGYYNFINIHMSFAVPLAFLYFALFLEQQRPKHLFYALGFLWIQTATIWYGGIPLALLLFLFFIAFFLLRPGGWRIRTISMLFIGGILLAIMLLPVGWPYFQTNAEMGFERSLQDVNHFRADLLSFFDAGRDHLFYSIVESGRYPGLFPGFVVYILSAMAILFGNRKYKAHHSSLCLNTLKVTSWISLLMTAVMCYFLFSGRKNINLLFFNIHISGLEYIVLTLLFLGITGLILKGWIWKSCGSNERQISTREWISLLWIFTFFCMLLTLGPVMHLKGQPICNGIYRYVYELFPGFKAIRISLRLAYLFLFLIGLLAAFGLRIIEQSLNKRLRYLVYIAPLLLLVEYLPGQLQYKEVDWENPPQVYQWLASQPEDFSIIEFPTKNEGIDSVYVFWSLYHKKKLVNGVSGFYPPFSSKIAYAVADLPKSRDVSTIRSVYKLRYILVHLDELFHESEQISWKEFKDNPSYGVKTVGQFDDVIVFELINMPEQKWSWNRVFSKELVSKYPNAMISVTFPDKKETLQQFVEIYFNKKVIKRFQPEPHNEVYQIYLPPPYLSAQPNQITIRQFYHFHNTAEFDDCYKIGQTNISSPVDIVAISDNTRRSGTASIWVNGANVIPCQRGYNAVAISPKTGNILTQNSFDTIKGVSESLRLAQFINKLSPGVIVALSLKRTGAKSLTAEAVEALNSIGAAAEPRDHALTASHVLIGVKGADPGTAVEGIGDFPITCVVGLDRRNNALIIKEFQLSK